MWWVTVAMQRFHGVDAKTLAARRDELRALRRPKIVKTAPQPLELPPQPVEPDPVEENPQPPTAAELAQLVAAAATGKGWT